MKKQMELYIHIPFCMKKCPYCDFLSFVESEERQREYLAALLKEIAFYGSKYREYDILTIYIGGGTPSWLKEDAIEAVLKKVQKCFTLLPDAEITIECNPGTVTDKKFAAYKEIGINRLSIGLQAADDGELKRLGRVHNYAQFLKTYELARKNGFNNINIDVMSGLPKQSVQDYRMSLQKIIRCKPEHISAYSLMIEEGTPFYEKYAADEERQKAGLKPQELPTEEEVCLMTQLTEQMLAQAGYEHYEISNYARGGHACRHNIGYWRRENYLGIGLGAASLIENVRYSNTRDLMAYIRLPEEKLRVLAEPVSRRAQMEEFMFLGLRMTEGISMTDFYQYFGIPIEAVYREVIGRLAKEELLVLRAGRIFLTKRGQEVSNYALAQFLLE